MAQRIVIATPALSDAATLTGLGTIAATLPVTNLQTVQPGKVARWTSLATVGLRADLGAAAAINLIALGPHNGTSAATWQIRAGASEAEADAGAGYDSGAVSMWPGTGRPAGYDSERLWSLAWLPRTGGPGAQTFRYWRIDVDDGANPAGYFDIGRLYLSAAWQPTKNLRYGWGLGWDDPSEHVQAIGGQRWGVRRAKGRVLPFALGSMIEDEMIGTADEIARLRGTTEDILVVRDPEATAWLHKYIVQGTLETLEPLINRTFNLYDSNYRVRQLVI